MKINKAINILTLVAPFIILIIIFIFFISSSNLSIEPTNLSIAFNISDPNREQIESLSIKTTDRSIEDVRVSVKGSPQSITYLETYNNYYNYLERTLNCIEKNISMLSAKIKKMPFSEDSINQSIKYNLANLEQNADNLRLTSDKMKARRDGIYLIKSNEYINHINSTLIAIKYNLSKLNQSIYNVILQINSSSNISGENAAKSNENFSLKFLNAIEENITEDSNKTYLYLDYLNPDKNYILISFLPNSFNKINNSETYFAFIKIIFLNNTRIGSYEAEILMSDAKSETLARIPVKIRVLPSKS
jgi:hypothetical protein